MLTAVSFNITIGMEADSPNIIGLEIHGKILYYFFTKKSAALSFHSSKLLRQVQNILDMCQKALMNTVRTPL